MYQCKKCGKAKGTHTADLPFGEVCKCALLKSGNKLRAHQESEAVKILERIRRRLFDFGIFNDPAAAGAPMGKNELLFRTHRDLKKWYYAGKK